MIVNWQYNILVKCASLWDMCVPSARAAALFKYVAAWQRCGEVFSSGEAATYLAISSRRDSGAATYLAIPSRRGSGAAPILLKTYVAPQRRWYVFLESQRCGSGAFSAAMDISGRQSVSAVTNVHFSSNLFFALSDSVVMIYIFVVTIKCCINRLYNMQSVFWAIFFSLFLSRMIRIVEIGVDDCNIRLVWKIALSSLQLIEVRINCAINDEICHLYSSLSMPHISFISAQRLNVEEGLCNYLHSVVFLISWHVCNDKKMESVDVMMMFIDKLEGAAYRHPR